MKKFSTLLLAAAAAMMIGGTAQAAGTPVLNDSGSLGVFTLTNNGGGSFTLTITGPSSLDFVNNSVTGGIPASFTAVQNFTATVNGTDLTITSGTYTKTFGTGNDIATLSYGFSSGLIGTGLNSNGLILSGLISAVAPNALPNWDFSPLVGGVNTFVLTGTSYVGTSSMLGVFTTAGASVTGNGSFSEAVPEPASMALLGIGLSGLFTVRRFLKRTVMA